MARLCVLVALAWLAEMLLNFLWVPLTAYSKQRGLDAASLGTIFALNVGTRFIPNFFVTQIGTRTELSMMVIVFAGYATAFQWPEATWALYVLAIAAGMGFMRPCVTLRAQALCHGDVDALSEASRQCGAARTLADVCSFLLPSAVFDTAGWRGVTAFGAGLAVCYLVLALPMHCRPGATVASAATQEENSKDAESELGASASEDGTLVEVPAGQPILWIDWAVSGAFVSTELQWNLLNTAMPAALVHSYMFPTSTIGLIVASGCLVALGYILALPTLPKAFNQHRPLNLLITYSGMSVAWLLMIGSLVLRLPACFFVAGCYLFLAMGNASQIVMLECLVGVCDLKSSTKILGVSEMIGCALGMVGSYGGEALLVLGMPAPFVACGTFSLLSTGFLWACLCQRRGQTEGSQETKSSTQDSAASPAQGLHSILFRTDSFISEELRHRKAQAAATAPAPGPARSMKQLAADFLDSLVQLVKGYREEKPDSGAAELLKMTIVSVDEARC